MERKDVIRSAFIVMYAIAALSIICPLGCAAEPPEVLLPKLDALKGFIAEAVGVYPRLFTVTNTAQQANALYNKIDAVTMMVEEGNYLGAAKKLEMDIAPKVNFCETQRVRAQSWLSDNPELSDVVYEFADTCQELIEDILDGLTNYNG